MCRRRGWCARQVGRQFGLGWLPSGRDCASPWSRRREGDIRRQRGVCAIQRRRADALSRRLAALAGSSEAPKAPGTLSPALAFAALLFELALDVCDARLETPAELVVLDLFASPPTSLLVLPLPL